MNRRDFLRGVASTAAFVAGSRARAEESIEASLFVEYNLQGRSIARNFMGLSYESALLSSPDYFSPDNPSLLGLMRALGRDGVLRIGGNTSERTLWRARGDAPTIPESYAITPRAIDRLAAMLRALGWGLIYGLNLARGTPESAATEAAYVARAVGQQLVAFQIGNEPEGFGRWSGVRPKNYDFAAFFTEWQDVHDAIRAVLPKVRFAGPDVAAETGWIPTFAKATGNGVVLLTRHYYADGPASDPAVTLAKLLRSAPNLDSTLADLQAYSQAAHLPFRIAEVNSVYSGGRAGVSDTLGAALWGLEVMFQVAAAGGAGVNFHGGDDKVYTPIGAGAGGRHRAMPLYYGMLMFARTSRGMLVPSRFQGNGPNVAAYVCRASNGELRVCLINKDVARGTRVRIDAGRTFTKSSVLRLIGGAVDATAGVKLGETTVDPFGGWTPKKSREVVRWNGREAVVSVPAASAALVMLE
jgi:hypothetical protein